MFVPKYTITDNLLANIKRVNSLVGEFNHRRFSQVVLVEFERLARAVSSFASTSIEGNPLPLTEVKKILKNKPDHARDSEKEVLNYNKALQVLDEQLAKEEVEVSLELILSIHKIVMDGLIEEFRRGRLREEHVVINDPLTRQVVYLPPDFKDVAPLIDDLISFTKESEHKIDPLILAGVLHKQMVLIHPFIDGNGRTTRLVTKVLLAKMGLDTFKLFSFEAYYNQNVAKYFQMVGERGNYYDLVGNFDFTKWLEYFTEGIIDELLRVQKLFPQVVATPETELQPHLLKILDYIKEKGFIKEKDYSKLTERAKATRVLDFQRLIDLGMIERKGKARATHYILKEN